MNNFLSKKKIHKDSFDGYLKFKSLKKFYKITGRKKHVQTAGKNTEKLKALIKKKSNQEFRNCQVCNSRQKKFLFDKNGFIHVKCKACGFVYVNPILKPKVQERTLKKENSYINVLKNKVNIQLDNFRFRYGLQKININKKKKRILDFGTGYGLFLDNAKKYNWDCFGYEINKDCMKILQNKKINIDNSFKKNFYDAITLWLVFEHVPYPNKLLSKIYLSLKKGGKLLINVPNVNSLSSLILKDKCTMFSGSQHVNHFSDKSLKMILNKNNFRLKSMETIISDAGTVLNYLNYGNTFSKDSKKLSFTDPKFIHKHKLGYTLLAIAEKK